MANYVEGSNAKILNFSDIVEAKNNKKIFSYTIENTTPVEEKKIQIPEFITRAAMERREAEKIARELEIQEIESKLEDYDHMENLLYIAQNVVFFVTFCLEFAAMFYLCYKLGLKEHPVFTQSQLNNRIMTGAFQSFVITGIFNMIAINVINYFADKSDDFEEFEDDEYEEFDD